MGARRESAASIQWLNERKDILGKIKGQVWLYLGDEPADVRLYAQSYKRDIERSWKASDVQTLNKEVVESQVVYGGDFHPFAQAQRAHLRILRELVEKRNIVLGLECFFKDKQFLVDQFLADEIEEAEFLQAVDWEQSWGFPWKHYKPLVDFAKKEGVRVLALNDSVEDSPGSLGLRDQSAAITISDSMKAHKDSLHYILFGDLHIAQNHLPSSVQNLFSEKLKKSTIYLNVEKIYFDLAEDGKENDVEIVRFGEGQFCVLVSPPWVKWQSYLMYLEENFDFGLDDDDEWEDRIDHTDHVSSLVQMIGTGLEKSFKTDDIEVYSLGDPQVLKVCREILTEEHYELAHYLVQQDMSFYIPHEGFFYLSKATVNHAATLGGQYIHGKLGARDRVLWDFPQDFLMLIWVEAMGFLLSKWVNPKRKAQTMNDLKKQLEAFDVQDKGREPLLLALDHKMSELLMVYNKKERPQKFSPSKKSSYALASRFLGEMLGERYFLLYQRGLVSLEGVLKLLGQDLNNDSFEEFYFQQLELLDRLELENSRNQL